ncbi:MAG: hypothetical protein ACR652_24335 [Methylocystis sp.]|uniref:hypothetical protein n=1 Tax=Methylocystis sp. TaxID=1911079 RepID=UPI003DA21D80
MNSPLPLGHHVPAPEHVGVADLVLPPGVQATNLRLVTNDGEPIAPSEVQEFLRAIDHRLFLRAFPFAQRGRWEWALCETWSANDRRRAWIQSGETPPDRDFDVVGFPPAELKLTTAKDTADYLLTCLKSQVQSRPEWAKYLARIDAYNERQTQRNQQPVVDYAMELAESSAGHLSGEQGKTRVFQSDDNQTSGKKRTKGIDAVIPAPQVGD